MAKVKEPTDVIELRDSRDGGFLWIDKEVLDLISKTEGLGNKGVMVYAWLCYYAHSKDQDCYPSINTLLKKCCLSRSSVIRALKKLEEIRAIKIQRRTGRNNIYRLLNVDTKIGNSRESIGRRETGISKDTGVSGDTTPVSLVTPLPVSAETPEQDLIEQELSNKNKQQPSAAYKEITDQVYKLGFNVYQLIGRFKKESKLRVDVPEDVIINVCQQYLIQKDSVRKQWPWFLKVFEEESRNYFARQNIKEHGKIKRDTGSIKDLMACLANGSFPGGVGCEGWRSAGRE